MRSWIRRHWRWALPAGVVLAGVGAWLVFGFFAFQTYFQDDEVDEALPFFTAGPAPSGIEGDETTEEMAEAMNDAMADDDMPMVEEVDEPMPDMPGPVTSQVPEPGVEAPEPAAPAESAPADPQDEPDVGEPTEETQPAQTQPAETQPAETQPQPAEPQIIVEASGSFIDRSHPTEGSALVLGDGSGQRFLRFEDFRTDNGPDLNVYLSAAPPGAPAGEFDNDFVDLGDLKGNVGSQNYEIPVGLDLDHYSTVAIWCVRFGVVFGVAELT
ncbi:MAG: DM13 domain-containing protein [Acidimicrobiia bacterium]|nr:DM13 domain-containing protein [Acidimicrobiia bacterium]